jgi:predicted nuclease with TOPRIM domain
MTDIIIRSGALRKKHFELSKDNEKLLKKISKRYGFSEKEILEYALGEKSPEIVGNKERIEQLREEIDRLLQDMFSAEGKWSAIRYQSHTLSKEVKSLAVALIGELSQNRTLRRQLKKEKKYDELRELAEHYLFDL